MFFGWPISSFVNTNKKQLFLQSLYIVIIPPYLLNFALTFILDIT